VFFSPTGLIRRVLVNPRVGFLWAGQVISQTGDMVFQIGLLWLVLEMTGRKDLTGLAGASMFLPTLLFGLLAGVLVDRVSRRKLMIIADAVRALLVLAIPLAHRLDALSPALLVVVTFCVATCAAAFNPARDALVPRLAAPSELPHVNALIQTSWQVAILLGPAVAGLLLSFTDVIHLFSFDAVTYLVSLAAIASISGRLRKTGEAAAEKAEPVFRQLRQGLAYVARDPLMRMLVFVTAIDNLILMGPAIVGPPILVRDVLGATDPRAYAWVQAALAGGMLVGAPFMATIGRRLPLGKLMLFGVILDGLTYAPLFWADTLPQIIGVVFVHSLFIPLITVSRTTLIQRHVPPEMHGRMFSVIGVCVIGGTALSSALTGVAAEVMSIQTVYLVIGVGAAATALPGFLSKALRRA